MKIKRAFAVITTALMITAAASFGNCGGVAASAVKISADIEAANEQSAAKNEAKKYSEMVQRSFLSSGNTCRLESKLEDARNGEKITVAYLGGSITEGGGGTPDTCYAKLSYNYIAENYGKGDNVEYVNAGVSGTPSILGNLRVKKDVLDKNADIVFVEFAVNDGMDQLHKDSYESLIRTILKQENEPAVILLFTTTDSGYTCQEHMSQIGDYYSLPMISVLNAVQPEVRSDRMKWKDYTADGIHPNKEGHKLVAEFIEYCFETIKARDAVDEPVDIPVVPKFGNSYEDAFLAEADYGNANPGLQIGDMGNFSVESRSIADFTKGAWVYSGMGTKPLKMTVKGNSLFLVCKRKNSDTMGKFDVMINGIRECTIDTNQSGGWGEPYAFQAIKRDGVNYMEVEIVPSWKSMGKTIEIFAVGFSQN